MGNLGQTYTINEYNPNTGLPNAWNGVVADVVDKFGNEVTNGITAGQVTISAIAVGGGQTVPFDTTNGHTADTQVNIDPKSSVAVFSKLLWTRERGQTAKYDSGSYTISNLQDPIGIQNLLKIGPVGVAGPGIPEGDYVQSVDPTAKTLTLAPYKTTGASTSDPIFINSAGNFTLKATVSQPLMWNGSPVQSVTPATSSPFVVSVGKRSGLKMIGTPPTTLSVGSPIPTIQIAVVDQWGNIMTTDNSDSLFLTTGSIKGTKTEQVVNGIATFSDLSLANIGGLPQSGVPQTLELKWVWQNQALPLVTTTVTLAAGQPYALKIVNPLVGGKTNSEIKPGSYIRASATPGGTESPIKVEVVDSAGNLVTSDNSTIVSIGPLATNGRGAVFVGNSKTKYTAKDPRKIAPLKNLPGVPNSWDFEATGQVKNGVVEFPDLYANFAGKGYILAAGTANFASQAGATTEPFEIAPSSVKFKKAAVQHKTTSAIHVGNGKDLAKTNTVLAGGSSNLPAAHALLRQPKKSSAKYLPQGHPSDQITATGVIKYGLGSLTANFDTISNLKSYQKFPPGGRPYPPVVGFDPATVPAAGPALSAAQRGKRLHAGSPVEQVVDVADVPAILRGQKRRIQECGERSSPGLAEASIVALNAEPLTAMVNSNQTFDLKGKTTDGTNKIELGKDEAEFRGLTLGLTVKAAGVLPANTTITEIDAAKGQITVSSKAMKSGEHTLTMVDFAGLGLSYLSSSAMFVVPSVKFLDPGGDHRPAGQPEVWDNPQAPGNQNWQYLYGGNGNVRQYQDFSVGLQGVQADGKVLAYSDWTTTIDWQGTDNSGRAQELQGTLGQGLPFAYFTVPTSTDSAGTTIQLLTSPKTTLGPHGNPHPVPVTVTTYDPGTGQAVTSGTGPFELEISYTLHDGLDTRFQQASTSGEQRKKNILTVADATSLSAGMSVSGNGIQADTTITEVIDSTHVKISKTPDEIKNEVLTFNALAQRHFDNFYGVYLPSGIAWQLNNKDTSGDATLTATLSSKNYFSIATLPGGTKGTFNPAFTTFLPHAYTFVTGSTSSFNYNQSTGNVATTFALQTKVMQAPQSTTDSGPLQALNATQYNNLLPGDLQALKGFNVNGQYTYVSPQGELLLWDGPVFNTQLTYTGILPLVPPLPNGGAQIPGIPGTGDAALWKNYLLPILRTVSTLEQSDGALVLDKIFPNDNNYLQAQSMYGAAQLVPILLEISQSTDPGLSAADKAQAATYAQLVYNAVKNRMESWLSANDDDALQMLYYQPKNLMEHNAPAGSQGWQSLMSILSGFLSSETLNDHQLIAGYFIKVAAFLAQYDNTWGQSTEAVSGGTTYLQGKLGDIVNLIVGDVSNYNRSSTTFPFLRNFDDWDMHSWADGAANSDVGTNLESSSEAMNYDSALIQWGAATGNQAMRDLGVYMYTSELQGVQTYWFSMKNQTDPFGHPTNVIPPQYLGSAAKGTQRTIVTKLNNNGGSYVGFIGLQTSRVAGIQFLPFSGSAYYLGQSPSFVATTYGLAQKGASAAGTIPLVPPTYQSLLLPYLALSDPKAAFSQYTQNINQISLVNPGDYIDNDAFNLHWIEVLQAYGQVDPSVTANTVFYTVFNNAGVRTYVAYNPTAMPLPVQFKDSSGNVLLSETVAPFATVASKGSGNSPQTVQTE